MEIESLVCSFGLAKKLKELGRKQDSHFFYEWYRDDIFRLCCKGEPYENYEGATFFSAFTISELLDILPESISLPTQEPYNFYYILIEKKKLYARENYKIIYCANYFFDILKMRLKEPGHLSSFWRTPFAKMEPNEKLADCLAELLIYLLENGIIKND